ncbi:hypothetical protein SDC9_192029 [bioreactor metagenome]|uniref:Uncharacterized protein n=1 Tax=bioreactor metagenome TaxID=1076179 RepID=A0A645I822_9ZZZZ
MEVCGVFHAGGKQAPALLTFAFPVKLLPPLGEKAEGGLAAGQQLHPLARLIESVPRGGILPGEVVTAGPQQAGHRLGRAGKQGVGVDAGCRQGQQAHG